MRFGMIGDNLVEKAVLASGLLLTPMLESYAAGLLRRRPIRLPLTRGTGVQAADTPSRRAAPA